MYIVRISVRFLLLMNVFSCDIDVDASVQKQYHFIMECLEAFQIQIHKIMLFPPPTNLPETWQMNAKTDQHMTWTQHESPYTFIDFILIMLIARYWTMVGVKEGGLCLHFGISKTRRIATEARTTWSCMK